MKSPIYLLGFAFFTILTHCHGQGTLLVEHFGSADPAGEGFSLLQSGSPSLTPVAGDLGTNAWSINLKANGEIAQYSQQLTPQQQADAASAGWVISLTLRILQPFNTSSFGTFAQFFTGTHGFLLFLDAQPNGDPIVRLAGVQYSLNGAGSGYHNYQLRYDAGTGLAGFWVDGSHLTDTAGSLNPSNAKFSWGEGQNPGEVIGANWNEASWSVIPEPSTWALLASGGLFLLAHRWRQRKS